MNRIPKFFVLTLVIVVVLWGMFLFNLNDKVYGLMKSKEMESPKISNYPTSNLDFQEKVIVEKIENKNLPKIVNTVALENKIQPELDEIGKEANNISILEKQKFYLTGFGETKTKSKSVSVPVKISVTLLPVKETKLANFDLIDAQVIIDEKSYSFNKGTAQIQKDSFTLNIISDTENSIFFSINGPIDFKIKDSDYKGDVIFDNEQFYIYEPEYRQFRLMDYATTITSIP